MTIYSLYVFNRKCLCVHYHSFNRSKSSNLTFQQEFKLVFGLLHSLRGISRKLGPSFANGDNFNSYSTNSYKMTLYELPTSLKFILLTDKNESTDQVKNCLKEFYINIFVQNVVRSPNWLEILNLEDEKQSSEKQKQNSNAYKSYFPERSIEEINKYFRALPFY